MLWIIVFTIVLVIIINCDSYTLSNYITGSLLGILVGGFFGALCWVIIGGLIGAFLPTEEYVVSETKLCALKDSAEMEGRYFLLSGYCDEDLVYRYVVETERGKQIKELNVTNNVYLKEGDYEPTIITYGHKLKHKWHYLFAGPPDSNYTVFMVPEGTVLSDEYEIDLE